MVYLDLLVKFESESLESLYIAEPDFYCWTLIISKIYP